MGTEEQEKQLQQEFEEKVSRLERKYEEKMTKLMNILGQEVWF